MLLDVHDRVGDISCECRGGRHRDAHILEDALFREVLSVIAYAESDGKRVMTEWNG